MQVAPRLGCLGNNWVDSWELTVSEEVSGWDSRSCARVDSIVPANNRALDLDRNIHFLFRLYFFVSVG